MGHLSIWHWAILALMVVLWIILPITTASSTKRKYGALKGVGGWLFMFAVTLHLVPLYLLGLVALLITGATTTGVDLGFMGAITLYIVMVGLGIWALVLLYRRTTNFIAVATWYTLVSGFLGLIVAIWMPIAGSIEYGVDFGLAWKIVNADIRVSSLIGQGVSGIIWALYLNLSRRVRNTFTEKDVPLADRDQPVIAG